MLTLCQKTPYCCLISNHGQASRTQLFLINPHDTDVGVESYIAVLVTILGSVKIIWSSLKRPSWKILSDVVWWSISDTRDEFFSALSCLLSRPHLSVCPPRSAFCLAFISIAQRQMKIGTQVLKLRNIILAEFCGLFAALQFRIMYPPLSQLSVYSRLHNIRSSEFNTPPMYMPINSSSSWISHDLLRRISRNLHLLDKCKFSTEFHENSTHILSWIFAWPRIINTNNVDNQLDATITVH